MNKLINIVLSGLLWRRYKFLLVSLLVLIVFVFLVGQVHQDYLAHAQISNKQAVGWSFVVKWLVWIVAIAVFLAINSWYNKKKQRQADKDENNSALQKIMQWRKNSPSSKQSKRHDMKEGAKEASTKTDTSDPFAHLRHKEKLRSYADIIIEKHESKK